MQIPFMKKKSVLSGPDDEWHAKVEDYTRFTPDLALLQQRKGWYMFAYGSEQLGHPFHKLIKNEGTPATAYSVQHYAMWKKSLGHASFAVPLEKAYGDEVQQQSHLWGFEKAPASLQRIKGELHFVTANQLITLDQYVENTVCYERRRLTFTIPHKLLIEEKDGKKVMSAQQTTFVTAWMYVGVQEYWDTQIDGFFKPVRLYQPTDPERPSFYHFSNLEYDD